MRSECLGCVREGEIPEVVVLQEEHRAESWGCGHLGILQASWVVWERKYRVRGEGRDGEIGGGEG